MFRLTSLLDYARPGAPDHGLTLRELRRAAAARLAAAGIETPDRDARLLIGQVLGLEPSLFLTQGDRHLTADEVHRVEPAIDRRCAREPVSRILGQRAFWSLSFTLSPETLDPRPDSETLVEVGLAALSDAGQPWRVLDLGTGSGCLLLSVLSERPQAGGIGLDVSASALSTAAANAQALGLAGRCRFLRADWAGGLAKILGDARFDLILCNPPYIATGELAGLEPEVSQFDPRAALDGGADGLSAYRILAPQLPGLLTPRGMVALEIGHTQAAAVSGLLDAAGLEVAAVRRDLAGLDRCVVARRRRTPPLAAPR